MPELTVEQKRQKRVLLKKAELLWKLVTTTSGVADLAEPMQRAEYHFDRLTKHQRTTVAVIVSKLDRGFHEIEDQETQAESGPTSVEPITPDEIIPPDHETDGSGTGD